MFGARISGRPAERRDKGPETSRSLVPPRACSSIEGEDDHRSAFLQVDQLILEVVVRERATDVGAVAGRHGDVLLAVDRVRNDPAIVAGAVIEVPQHVAGLRVERFDPAVRGPDEEETPRRGQEGRVRDDLVPLLPGELACRGITGRDTAVGTRLARRVGPY